LLLVRGEMRANRFCRAALAAITSVFVHVGCNTTPDGEGCSQNPDTCPNGYACSCFLFCGCTPGCKWIGDCPVGNHCEPGWIGGAGQCAPGCVTNDNCPAHMFCPLLSEGCGFDPCPACKGGCRDDSECSAGAHCLFGECFAPRAPPCHNASDCPGSECQPFGGSLRGLAWDAGFVCRGGCESTSECVCTDAHSRPAIAPIRCDAVSSDAGDVPDAAVMP
jgi:hypothetical protein